MKQFVNETLAMQQDYLWFLAALVLFAACVLAMRPVLDRRAYPWAAWVLGGNLAMALAELVRLVQIVRPPERGSPNLELDLLHGVILGVQAWAIWRPAGARAFGWVLLGEILGFAALRHFYPWTVTMGLVIAATAGLVWRARQESDPTGRRLAWSLMPGFWWSPIGPLTCALNSWIISQWAGAYLAGFPREEGVTIYTVGLRRWETTGPWGLWVAAILLVTGVCALWVMTQRRWTERERQELRRFLPWMGVWLVAGLALAAALGWRTRREYEAAQKRQVSLAARLLDSADLARAFGPGFNPRWVDTGRGFSQALLNRENQAAVLPVRQQLSVIQAELPDDTFALLMLERNGRRTIAASAATFVTRSDRIIALDPDPDFVPARPEPRFLPPHQENHGLMTGARAPLYFSDGRFLGWLTLESGVGEWLARQAQVRLQSLTMVGLGLGLAFLGLRQRLRNLASDEIRREAEIARQANEAKSQFLARVSHELRTPIQSVLGNCDMLQLALLDESARARLTALRQHGELMSRLVEDLLDLGALQTGRFNLAPQPVQLTGLVRQTTESLRPRAETKGLILRVTITEPEQVWRLADGQRVQQVVNNLVSNAIKFTDRGRVEVDFGPAPEGDLQLTVSDTGPGIPPDEGWKLFQPFARLQATANKEGSGLGLALARGICEDMQGGLVLARNTPGACFMARFRLPLCAPPSGQGEALQMPSLHGRSILVVDDNTLIRELFRSCFVELGARCDVADGGPMALEQAAANNYETIVLDLAMPGMSGVEVARTLRHLGSTRPRIIGVSAHASAADRSQALAAGMDVFLTKPVDLRVLVKEINALPAGPLVSPQLAELIARLREIFRQEAPAMADALATALAKGDMETLATKAHYLKNSTDALGLHELGAACANLESAAREQRLPAIGPATDACLVQLRAWC
jgi:signal transduction histidine kinase/CheY-like chemotaxis protein